jgi:hypothetical protein
MSENRSIHDEAKAKAADARHVEATAPAYAGDIAQVLENDGETAKVVHADGTIDIIDAHALGGEVDGMPPGYFRSPQFIGTVMVRPSRLERLSPRSVSF